MSTYARCRGCDSLMPDPVAHVCGRDVFAEVADERARQDAKWGEQNHPDVAAGIVGEPDAAELGARFYGVPAAPVAKRDTDLAADSRQVTWAHIAVEELAEAVEAAALGDEEATRTEALQLAAVCVQWAQAIDRRKARREAGR